MNKLFATIGVTALLVTSLFAGQQTQTDTNSLAVLSTNTFKLSGDVTGSFTNGQTFADAQFIDGTKTTDMQCAVGGFFTNTTAAASNITFRIAASVDGANWTNSAFAVGVSVPATSTNWAVTLFKITNPAPLYGLRAIENTNAAAVTGRAGTMYFKVYSKNGL